MHTLPNIVYIHGHDVGRMIAPYGYNTPTPNLQRFAESAITFRQAFSAAPTCSPSRAALLTGRFPHCCGMHGLATPAFGFKLEHPEHHLSNFLKENGYTTALAGNQHEARAPLLDMATLGYDHWLNYTADGALKREETVGAATRFIEQHHEHPFFLSCGFGETHRENDNRGRRHTRDADVPNVDELDGRYTRPPAPIPDTATTRQDWQSFRLGAERLDAKIGAVIAAIDRRGLQDDTLVIVTADHGIAWPHGKGNLTDMGLGVLLMMRGPRGSGFEGGRVTDALVSHMDVYPTLCEWLRLEPPPWLQGESLLPIVDGRAESIRDHVFGEQGWHGWQMDPQRSVRTERYKYIRRKPLKTHLRIVDPGPTNDWLRDLGYCERPNEVELLYDLYFDPVELHNVADDPEYAGELTKLRSLVDQWMKETEDPFIDDTIPEPVDATK